VEKDSRKLRKKQTKEEKGKKRGRGTWRIKERGGSEKRRYE